MANPTLKEQLIALLRECFTELKVGPMQQSMALMFITKQSEAELVDMARMLVMVGRKFELALAERAEIQQVPLALVTDKTA